MTNHTGELAPLAREWRRVEDELSRLNRSELSEMLRLMFFFGARCAVMGVVHSGKPAMTMVLMNMELRAFDQEATDEHD